MKLRTISSRSIDRARAVGRVRGHSPVAFVRRGIITKTNGKPLRNSQPIIPDHKPIRTNFA